MTDQQKLIKYFAILLACLLCAAIIFGIVEVLGMIFNFGRSNDDMILENSVEFEISQDIRSLYVDIDAAEFKIVQGECFSLSSNIKNLRVDQNNGTLKITHRHKKLAINSSTKLGEILLTIPTAAHFDKVEIDAGAGDVEVSFLSADNLSFDLGAGRVRIERLETKIDTHIDAGAGSFEIEDGRITCLDLDLGVGKSVIRASLEGRTDIDCGVGKTDITILGNKADYTMFINTGVGSIYVDGDIIISDSVFGNGANRIDVDGGVGSVDINFEND